MWTHKKHKGQFKGRYSKSSSGERIFEIFNDKKCYSFESFQAAKALQWVKS